MAELTIADLGPLPDIYQSSRAVFDVLIGEDKALPLVKACSSGDIIALGSMLSQPQWAKIALEKPHCIYYQERPSDDKSDVRSVDAKPTLTLERLIIIAARDGHAAAVSSLLSFALQQGLNPSSVITRWAVDRAINNGHAAVIEAMASADPTVVAFPLGHDNRPLIHAIKRKQTAVVAVLLQLGADPIQTRKVVSYNLSLLSLAVKVEGTRMTELLLEHGVSVACSGALHLAAKRGALDTMRLLMQHGADVNELLPEDSLYSSWTPMHFAASCGQVDAIKLLERNGARPDMKDENGRTPAQLLEQHKP